LHAQYQLRQGEKYEIGSLPQKGLYLYGFMERKGGRKPREWVGEREERGGEAEAMTNSRGLSRNQFNAQFQQHRPRRKQQPEESGAHSTFCILQSTASSANRLEPMPINPLNL